MDLVAPANLADDVIEPKPGRELSVRDRRRDRITFGNGEVAANDDVFDRLDAVGELKG